MSSLTSTIDTSSTFSLPEAAAWYVRHGFPVFPLRPRDKAPATRHGFHDATTDAAQVVNWWRESPAANIGIPTGEASGLLVMDADPRNGAPADRLDLMDLLGPWPDTAEVLTGGGGRHVYFRHPGGVFPKELAPGVDCKGTGGYVVAPPSAHPSGGVYAFDGADGCRALLEVADCPAWLLPFRKGEGGTAGGRRAAAPAGAAIVEGSRNNTLASIAGAMRARGLGESAIAAALLAENQERCNPPLPDDEVRRIAKSYARYPAGRLDHAARGLDVDAAQTESEVLAVLNALPFWAKRFRWAAFRQRGNTLIGITGDGEECRFDTDKLTRFAHAQSKILQSLRVMIPSPKKGHVGETWAMACELMMRAAASDVVSVGAPEDDLRADLIRCYYAAREPRIENPEHLFDLMHELRDYKRQPHADLAPRAVFVHEGQMYLYPDVFRQWLSTPVGGNRYLTLPALREAAGLLGLTPIEKERERDGERLRMTFWVAPMEVLGD